MIIYNYHPITRELLGKTKLGDSDKNPLEVGKYIVPANATKVTPSVVAMENEALIFNGSGWSLVPDFRGVSGWLQTGEAVKIDNLGEVLPVDFIDYDPVLLAEGETAEYEQAQAEAEAQAETETA